MEIGERGKLTQNASVLIQIKKLMKTLSFLLSLLQLYQLGGDQIAQNNAFRCKTRS